jgi:tRNA threonylcarbamoyladenosine biosynthesis protein TsaB
LPDAVHFMNSACILAIDTATEVCSVALLKNGELRGRSERVGQRHSERALPMVDELLKEHGTTLRDLDYLCFGAGPGSFTGLRIACGLVQGLAWGAAKAVIPVGNLRALAHRVLVENPGVDTVLCAIDARMHEAYCAVYRRGTDLVEMQPPALAAPTQLSRLAGDVDAVAGNALAVFPDAWPAVARQARFPSASADACDIARIASSPAMLALAVAPHLAAPLYVRDHVASTTAERRARAALA